MGNLSKTPIDPTGKYVLTTRCRTGRSVRGTRLPPCCSFEERRELERVIVKGLLGLTGELKGDYFPLHGSHHTLPSQAVCPKKRKKNSELVVIFSKNQTQPFSSPPVVVATGPMPVVSSTMTPRTSSSGSTKKIKCALSPCKRVMPLSKSSSDSPLPPKVSKRSSRPKDTTSCT